MKWKCWIDTGGTFTDCIGIDPEGRDLRVKVLSSGMLRLSALPVKNGNLQLYQLPYTLPRDFFKDFHIEVNHGGRSWSGRITSFDPDTHQLATHPEFPGAWKDKQTITLSSGEEAPVLGIRLLTGTALGQPFPQLTLRLGTTIATNALLERKGAKTFLVLTDGFSDLLEIGTQQRPDLFQLDIQKPLPLYMAKEVHPGRLNASGAVEQEAAEEALRRIVNAWKESEAEAVAISLLHAYKNGEQEKALAQKLKKAGVKYVSCSYEIAPRIKYLERTQTTLTNAYLTPLVSRYLGRIGNALGGIAFQVMTSAGGLVQNDRFLARDALFSGPAGGVAGAAAVAQACEQDRIIAFDMGGTSTDVSRYEGKFEYMYEQVVNQATLFGTSLAIETVSAGGGSICGFDGYRLQVGPESAGARPGPACYGAGGPLTLTDVNLLLGRLDPETFGIPVHREAAEEALQAFIGQMKASNHPVARQEQVLEDLLMLANENMAGAIRKISTLKGYDISDYALVAFGGAGGIHACDMAELLGMKQIILPSDAGLLSAYGMGISREEVVEVRQLLVGWNETKDKLLSHFSDLEKQAFARLQQSGRDPHDFTIDRKVIRMRLKGQENTIDLDVTTLDQVPDLFRNTYEQEYGYWMEGYDAEVESMLVFVREKTGWTPDPASRGKQFTPESDRTLSTYIDNRWQHIPVFEIDNLQAGAQFEGPALVPGAHATFFIKPGWKAMRNSSGHLIAEKTDPGKSLRKTTSGIAADRALFASRLMGIAENMGSMLQRTAFSVNVKERLDFSCAVFDREGRLIANAPHVPVHLGSMGTCVRSLLTHWDPLPGDTMITNHPAYGGSHLPDVTLVSPVFLEGERIGFVANRAHHAEIGGISPGSMSPDAKNLLEEGVVISPVKIVSSGKVDWKKINSLFSSGPYPSRSVRENEADIRGGLAANNKGAKQLQELAAFTGTAPLQRVMDQIREHARDRLKIKLKEYHGKNESFTEKLDDGSPMTLRLYWEHGRLIFDYSGTSAVHPQNFNATPAIVNSVTAYVLRVLVNEYLPLNDGLLEPVEIRLPQNCLLNPVFSPTPDACPAVAAGNTEVSQRLTDLLLRAFGLAACSQGTMNNVVFGNDRFGYYETLGGGTGAGQGFSGSHAVHSHMTNTRITDPEIIEHRYPLRILETAIRSATGGAGAFAGGNGLVRKYQFLAPVRLSLLTQHRESAPFGLEGGQPGKPGMQILIRASGHEEALPAAASISVHAQEVLVMETPGGGGFGKPGETKPGD